MLYCLFLTLLLPYAAFAQSEGPQAARVRALAVVELESQYPDDASRLEVRVRRVEGTFGEEETLRLVFPATDVRPRSTTQVKLFTGSDEDGWQKAGWALLYIAHFDSVIVAATTMKAGDEMIPADAGMARIETTTFRGEPLRPSDLRALAASGALFAARTLREGRVLRPSDLRAAYAAELGTSVLMRYRRGAITFNLSCKAREAGHVDDAVRLHSTETGKTYRARLTGPGTAEWIATL